MICYHRYIKSDCIAGFHVVILNYTVEIFEFVWQSFQQTNVKIMHLYGHTYFMLWLYVWLMFFHPLTVEHPKKTLSYFVI